MPPRQPSRSGFSRSDHAWEFVGDEVARLEAPYTPRYDFQGVSDDAELARISARLGIRPVGS